MLFLFALLTVICFASCKTVIYTGNIGNQVQTQVQLSQKNFKVLGSFTGSATARTATMGIKNAEGLFAEAKANLISNAKSAGVELTGARTLINVTYDMLQNPNRVHVVIHAEIIEFL